MDPFKLITNGIPGIQHIVIELEQSVTVTNTNSTSSTTAEGNATERQDADLSRAVSDGANTTAERLCKREAACVRAACDCTSSTPSAGGNAAVSK